MHNTPEAATVKPPQQNSTSPILPEGYLLRDYSIIKMLGHGGFGITYLAQEDITDKLVVIKENYPTTVSFRDMASLTVGPLTDNHKETYDWALTRFLNVAKILSRLSHPNIVPILAAFKALGTAYYVMPHVEGTDLHKAAPAPDDITAEWLLPVLEKILHALNYLHEQKIIHRDIKPNNILMNATGEPILIDFGTERTQENTLPYTQIGTTGYMPLEQLSAGGNRGPWIDFYALGATCHRLITGVVPPRYLDRIDEDEYIPLAGNASLAGRFPEHVLSSIDKALSMKRSERWQSAQEWLAALKTQQSVASAPIQTAPQTPPTPVKQVQPETIPATLTREQAQEELARLGIYSREYNNTLRSAAEKGEAHLITLLLSAGADVNVADDFGRTPLSEAVKNDDTKCLKLLLDAPGIEVNKTDKYGDTPLYWAAYKGHTKCVRLLLAAPGIDINKASSNGWTPLHCAAINGHTECVRLLLAAPGIDINKTSSNGTTPLYWAEKNNHNECAHLIRATGGTVHSSLTSEQAQEELARLGIYSREYNNTLRSAAEKGEAHLITLLLSAGADVNVADDFGRTPLSEAVKNDDTKCLKLLLDAPGIEVNKTDKYGDTPLYWAAYKGHTKCVRLLLAAPGIDINKASSNGWTPLHCAAINGHTECVRLLLAAPGIDINKTGSNGTTPLCWAEKNNHTECARLLLAAPGININQANQSGNTPLILTALNGHMECVRLLLAAPGININQAGQDGNTPLICAAGNGHMECVRLLLAAPGININQANRKGSTPLICAAEKGHKECVRLLLAAPGIDVNKANRHGDTPLRLAAFNGHTECVRLLLSAPGIDVNKADNGGGTPLSCAVLNGHTECANLIRAAGARR